MKKVPRVVIGGTNSGCGKTTITCAILTLLVEKGLATGSFKCGPDYIDPMFHREVIGTASSNLDPFFFGETLLQERLSVNSKDNDINIIEGVMGFYDGMRLDTAEGSTYSVSKTTNTPVILTVNCKGMANSAIALIKGFCEYRQDNLIAGVILNQMSSGTYKSVKKAIEEELPQIKVLGHLPKLPEGLLLESRHLGLITAGEIPFLQEKLHQLAQLAGETLDLEGIIALANEAEDLPLVEEKVKPLGNVKIGIAKDNAFCFYYHDNLQLLCQLGAELIPFSPVHDAHLPEDISALYFGGGYPELYLEQLSQNNTMKGEIYYALSKGMPCIAECGGFMYLTEEILGEPMVGYLKGSCHNTKKLGRFGYITIEAKKDNLILPKGGQVKAHEFHYFDSTDNGSDYHAVKPSGVQWDCVVATEHLYGGYPHLSFHSNPEVAKRFVQKAIEF